MLGALAVATVAVILALRRRRPWDAALFALAPALLLTATVNWDLLAIGLAAFGLLAWARQTTGAGRRCCSASAGAAKLWPLFLLGPILVLALRAGRVRAALTADRHRSGRPGAGEPAGSAAYRENWDRFFELNTDRPIDWGTLWYVGRYLDGKVGSDPPGLGAVRVAERQHPHAQHLSYALFGLACLGVAVLALRAPRRPRLAQLAFLVVAAFLIFSKVWSQQFVLWLLPLAVLARPKWGAFLAWQLAEVCYFAAFYGELLGASTNRPVFPEGVFVLAVDAAAGHRGAALRAGRPGHPAPGAGRGAGHLRRTTRTAASSTAPRTRRGWTAGDAGPAISEPSPRDPAHQPDAPQMPPPSRIRADRPPRRAISCGVMPRPSTGASIGDLPRRARAWPRSSTTVRTPSSRR